MFELKLRIYFNVFHTHFKLESKKKLEEINYY